jgi:hypothetical protein
MELLAQASDALARLAGTVAERLEIPGPVVLAGGRLQRRGPLRALVVERLRGAGLTDVDILRGEPVTGAARLVECWYDGRVGWAVASAGETPSPRNVRAPQGRVVANSDPG